MSLTLDLDPSCGLSENEWARYTALAAKRRKETLSGKELAELRGFSDRLEKLSARRMELVAELANRRGTTFDEEFQKLGIKPRYV